MIGGLNDARGRRYNGKMIEFRMSADADWQLGQVSKKHTAPTVVYTVPDHKCVLGWEIHEFVVRKDLTNTK